MTPLKLRYFLYVLEKHDAILYTRYPVVARALGLAAV